MEIQHKTEGHGGSFSIEENGLTLAMMTYVWAGEEKMIIDHTEVSPILKGKGVGNELVEAAVHMARKDGFKIMPLCPFAKAVMEKNMDYQDVHA